METGSGKACRECGQIVLDERSVALVELKRVVDRMAEVATEIDRCTDMQRWWALQDEFTALMAKADALCEDMSC